MPADAPFITVADGRATLRFKSSLYESSALAKAAHSLSAECFVQLDVQGDSTLVRLVARQPMVNLEACAGRMANEALDYQLRADLQRQTEPVRQLIIAQAFSKTNLFAPELDRAGLEQDPLGLKGQDRV